MSRLADALAPQAHPGWVWARRGWVVCQLLTWIPRGLTLPDNYSASGVVVSRSALPLTRWIVYSEPTAWAVWGVAMAALLLVGWGRATRLGILVALLGIWSLNFHEGLNFKAYDRLMFWQGLVLLCAPGGGSGAVGNPGARYAMMLVYCGIYGSTGWMKALVEPTWGNGDVLRFALADDNFGLRPVGTFLAANPGLLVPLSWGTLLFECGFPVAVWLRRLRPAFLVGGVALHLGIFAMMHVNTFSLVAISMYPVLLDAEQWERLRRWLGGGLGRAVVAAIALPFLVGWAAPRVAAAWWGARTEAPFAMPSPALVRQLREDTTFLAGRFDAELDPALAPWITSRWESDGWAVTAEAGRLVARRGSGPCFAAHYDVQPGRRAGPDDDATGIAALLALGDALGRDPAGGGTLVAFTGALPDGVCVGPVVLDQLGRYRHGLGTQAWPGAWSWLLSSEGSFLGIAGPPGAVGAWGQSLVHASQVPILALPSGQDVAGWRGHGRGLPADAVLLTDTGRLRGPDRVDELAWDELAWVVEALVRVSGPH